MVAGVLISGIGIAQPTQFVQLADLPGSCDTFNGGLVSSWGPLMFDSEGNLVGTALRGGQGSGGIFSLSSSGAFNVLDQFPYESASILWTQGPDGNFYGVHPEKALPPSSGSVIRMTPSGSITPLYTFSGTDNNGLNVDGADPNIVVVGSDGNLYGVTDRGGPNGYGTVFKLSLNGVLSTLSARLATDGDDSSALFQGADGNFYGVAQLGGANGNGTVFKFTPQGIYSVLHTFNALDDLGHNADGAIPSSLTSEPDGALYGTTKMGGAAGNGEVFTISTDGTFSALHTFSASDSAGTNVDGTAPYALIHGPDGNLYGAASGGGLGGTGVVFKLTSSGAYSELHEFKALNTFNYNIDGAGPTTLTFGDDGFLYGGTSGGGCLASGTLFKVNLAGYRPDDFDATGTSDLLQFNTSTHQLVVNLMNGSAVTGTFTSAITAGYYPAAVGDFNGDGAVDILWTSTNDDLYIWFGKVGTSGFNAKYAGTYPTGWAIFGAGDINGDGKADVLWINQSTNQVAYWLMSGVSRIGSYVASYASDYYPVATGDFDGDGLVDIMWSSAKNDLYIWRGNARKSTGFSPKYVTTFPAGWSIVGRGDIDGDGRDDLVWMQSSGTRWGYWLMNGATIKSIVTKNTALGRTIAAIGDFNDDGLADIVWNNGTGLELWSNISWLDSGQLDISFSPTTLSGFDATMPVFNSGVAPSALIH